MTSARTPSAPRVIPRPSASTVAKTTVLVTVFVAASSVLTLPAQTLSPAADSTLHSLFDSRDFVGESAGPIAWLPSGTAYTTLDRTPVSPNDREIVQVDAATGRRTVLVPAEQLRAPGSAGPIALDGYAFSRDFNLVLLYTNAQRNWHHGNTRGDYWVLNRRTGALRKLGGPNAQPASLRFAKFSPQGDRVAYVRDNDLYVERVSDGAITRLTTDGSATILNGVADWVDEEELYLRDCFRWSPDGTAIAYWQFDQSGVPIYDIINDTDSLYPTITPQPYPVPGATNASVRAGVVSSSGGPTTWLRLPGDPRQHYIPYLEWSGPHDLLVQHLDRLQQHDDVVLADAATGAVHTIFTEQDSAWVDVDRDIPWIDNGRRFLWLSDRDGWRHVYSIARDGRDVRLLTPGDYDVERIDGVDERHDILYVTASPQNAAQRYLFRVPLRNGGPATRVTPTGRPGTHTYQISPNGAWALHTYSTFDTPPITEVVQLPRHTIQRTIITNDALRAAAQPLITSPVEFFTVPVGGGVTLDGWMIKPPHFDPSRKYPVFVYVYGEPAGQTVTDRWGGVNILWHRFIADQGYIVLSVDNQGTPAPKGRHWRKLIYGAIGPLASRQQAAAIRELERTRPYLDSTRVGIHGHSGGGSQTLNALFRYPDVYQLGEAVSSVPDQRFYDSIYEERYVGLPQQHPENYQVSSPINFAAGLRGKLLLVHGSGDDNVHYKGAEALANRLIALGKPFDFMMYPNRSHCDCEGPGTTLHLYTLLTRYLLSNIPAGPR